MILGAKSKASQNYAWLAIDSRKKAVKRPADTEIIRRKTLNSCQNCARQKVEREENEAI